MKFSNSPTVSHICQFVASKLLIGYKFFESKNNKKLYNYKVVGTTHHPHIGAVVEDIHFCNSIAECMRVIEHYRNNFSYTNINWRHNKD